MNNAFLFNSYARLPLPLLRQQTQPSFSAAYFTFLEPLGLVRPPCLLLLLAAVRASALGRLVAAHARPERNVNPRRCREAEALGHLDQVQLVHVEYRPQAVRCIRLQVRAVPVLGRLVEVVVLGDERLELALDVCLAVRVSWLVSPSNVVYAV
jgi:hypothetical protein